MSDENPAEEASDQAVAPPSSPPPAPAPGMTAGGYAYTVVEDAAQTPVAPPKPARSVGRPIAIVGGLLVAGVALVAAGWFASGLFDDGGSGGDHGDANVASLLRAFSAGENVVAQYQGELPPGFPDDVPVYDGAEVVASTRQFSDGNAAYLVIWDTNDARDDVIAGLRESFDADPWQIEAGNEDRNGSLLRFSKIDDIDVTGVVLALDSKDRDVTTILVSLQVVSGADDAGDEPFEPPVSRVLPEGFPEGVPQYPEAILIETAYQQAPSSLQFAVSLISRDDAADVLSFYRDAFEENGWTVGDGDASDSPLQGAEAITFDGEDGDVSGRIITGDFGEDDDYVRIDIELALNE